MGHFISRLFQSALHVEKNTRAIQNRKHLRMRYPFQPTGRSADRFHTETGGRFAFTWYSCEISYRSEILAPVQQLG